jgi:hypothetical protein
MIDCIARLVYYQARLCLQRSRMLLTNMATSAAQQSIQRPSIWWFMDVPCWNVPKDLKRYIWYLERNLARTALVDALRPVKSG